MNALSNRDMHEYLRFIVKIKVEHPPLLKILDTPLEMRRGRSESIEKGSREKIEKRHKGTERQFEEEEEKHQHLPLLVVQLPDGIVPLSSRLDSAVRP